MADDESSNVKITFKKRKNFRPRKLNTSSYEDENDESDILCKVEETKTVQKQRSRPNGVSLAELALGVKTSAVEDTLTNSKDVFKTKTGGLVHMKDIKPGSVKTQDDAYDVGIGTQFSAETNKRDEDDEMMKYIEEKLMERKKKIGKGTEEYDLANSFCTPEDAALQALPAHLKHASSSNKSEEMLSNQMLSGIPEVDLGIEAKIKNIEATEEAKLHLLRERRNQKEGPSQFVPSNVTVNFAQPNKINVEETVNPLPTKCEKRKDGESATDDFYYERFKKQFKRF